MWAVAASLLALSAVDWLFIASPASDLQSHRGSSPDASSTPAADKAAETKQQGSGMQRSIAVVAADSQLCLLFLAQAMCLAVRDARLLGP